jgi:hypothetical protein
VGNNEKVKGKKYQGPKFIIIESKGVPNPIADIASQHLHTGVKFDPNFDFTRVPEELVRITNKKSNKADSKMHFNESEVLFTFTSHFGCSIKVTLFLPETAQ